MSQPKITFLRFNASISISFTILLAVSIGTLYQCDAVTLKANEVGITNYRNEYDDSKNQENLLHGNAQEFKFQRYQSPIAIKKALSLTRQSPFKWYQGKDGRKGHVSSTKLGGDWVLAESEQVAVQCTAEEVLRAHLSSDLQEKWNANDVLECHFKCRKASAKEADMHNQNVNKEKVAFWGGRGSKKHSSKLWQQQRVYQQDLVLRSQRIIRSHTGVMRYSQTITIDKIGKDNFTVLIYMDPIHQTYATKKKPFESLSVYVSLKQNGENVDIYAAGVMEVNRKVVPNFVVFDASGIAGQMAGKGTLWLGAFFEERRVKALGDYQ